MATVHAKLDRVQVGELAGPVGLTCDAGQSVWAATYTDIATGIQTTVQLCVTDGVAPCDNGGLLYLLEAGDIIIDDSECP